MKTYNVTFETRNEIVSDFQIKAENIKEAKRLAQSNKTSEFKGCKTTVRLAK